VSKKKSNGPRVLYIDIENTPILAYIWELFQTNAIHVVKDWELLSVAYQWEGQKKIHCIARCDFKNNSEKKLVQHIWNLLNESDIIIGQNSKEFDLKKINAKFAQYKMLPPSPYTQIDTKIVSKSNFRFSSHSLNNMSKLINNREKIDAGGFPLWLGCMAGKKSSWKKMKKYNKRDVVLTRELYKDDFRPWVKNHPNIAHMLDNPDGCPACGGMKFQSRGYVFKQQNRYRRVQCLTCGKWSRSSKPEKGNKPKVVNI